MCCTNLSEIPRELLRDIPGWTDAPVPICLNGDYRALAWCCKPGHSLSSGMACKRDLRLKEIGLSREEFTRIKDEFSDLHDWESKYACFGSFSYCCMRYQNCPRRDAGFSDKYPGQDYDVIYEKYAELKIDLSNRILKAAKNKALVEHLIDEKIS